MNKLELLCNRWFQKSTGNTYFTAKAVYNGEVIANIYYEYGYGDQWLDSLTSKLIINQLCRGDKQTPHKFIKQLEQTGIAVFTSVIDVNRKKDLQG